MEQKILTRTSANWTNNEVVRKREGYLHKQGSGNSLFGRKNWKRRWFVLDKGIIQYYENKYMCKNKLDPYGAIRFFRGDKIERIEDPKRDFVMVLKTLKRTLYLYAETEEEMNSWMLDI